ncbi:MAG: GNAT family N-acetyltransferase [Phycisphaerae bacterium]|nr:GNAT family N-acetyltransferase [Phycisphaerae bacterium]
MRGEPGDVLSAAIRPMRATDALAVASLHGKGIPTGFISSLGPKFLEDLYAAIEASSSGFGFVCDLGAPVGFIACATNTGALYKEVLKTTGPRLALHVLPRLWRPNVLKHTLQTLFYSGDVGDDLPEAEILSIVVAERLRGRGMGKALMHRAMAAMRGRDIEQVRVAFWSGNHAAQALYQSCGFREARVREHHGLPMSLYVSGVAQAVASLRPAPGSSEALALRAPK